MNVREHGRKATVIWRAMHLSVAVTVVGILAAMARPEAANGIGIMVGAFQGSLGLFTGAYSYSQGKVDEVRAGGVRRASGAVPEVS